MAYKNIFNQNILKGEEKFSMSKDLIPQIQAKYNEILKHREAIIEAFIAETGCHPSECEQVITHDMNTIKWFVRKRGE